MGLSAPWLLPILWVLDGHATPLKPMHVVHGAHFEAPESTLFRESAMRHARTSSENALSRIGGHGTTSTDGLHAQPRSLTDIPSSSSSVNHPLLVGVVIGVAVTLLALAFGYIIRGMFRRRKALKARFGRPLSIPLRPSAPREFRHLQHITTSQSSMTSPTSTMASSLRVAHRRPDGSWAFTDELYDRDRDPGPDPTLPVSPMSGPLSSMTGPPSPMTGPPSPMIFPTSPVSDSSGTAFSYDDASSSKTGPPPYIDPTLNPLPRPLPRRESEKFRGGRRPFGR